MLTLKYIVNPENGNYMLEKNLYTNAEWLYCEDEDKNKYVLYKGRPAFLAHFTEGSQCRIEGLEERFSFSDPLCRQLIAIAEEKGKARFSF